ncbi:tryptophan-rich sensory protein [Candidatus Babeliales bacterium]|nr:tryptophan-rich sensory protein [Candidatus Babeliales bacterium]
MTPRNIWRLIIALILCHGAGIMGVLFTNQQSTWYNLLKKPSFTPPSWIFGPVWSILYTCMAVALYIIWNVGFDSPEGRYALIAFGIQLAANTVWSFLFFKFHLIFVALLDCIVLFVAIIITMNAFAQIEPVAAYFLIPYFVWVGFACVLNMGLWLLNKK